MFFFKLTLILKYLTVKTKLQFIRLRRTWNINLNLKILKIITIVSIFWTSKNNQEVLKKRVFKSGKAVEFGFKGLSVAVHRIKGPRTALGPSFVFSKTWWSDRKCPECVIPNTRKKDPCTRYNRFGFKPCIPFLGPIP